MNIELSPSQERKLHSILDRGFDTLNEITEKSSPFLQKLSNKGLQNNLESTHNSQKTNAQTSHKSFIINSELKSLQEKLACLEARLSSKSEPKPLKIQTKLPTPTLKMSAENTPRSTSTLSRKSFKRAKVRKLQDVEKEIEKIERIERSITPSPASFQKIRAKVTGRVAGKSKMGETQNRLKKENEDLKAEVSRLEKMMTGLEKVKEDYENLLVAFEKSERIRTKQKEIIAKLKAELSTFI